MDEMMVLDACEWDEDAWEDADEGVWEDDFDLEVGFDPYMGCYSDDC